ncbi:hypothetical protein FRC09_017919 [Ceratobasidium sp. 395]|nr:hypothetical protein FRC09_017919 [Ceratobasidium sp. 395]
MQGDVIGLVYQIGGGDALTYERLRQNCNGRYQVGNFDPVNRPETCNDQVSTCCCNSIAYALSMLCLNCQFGAGSGVGQDTGLDAPTGYYRTYLGNCQPVTNRSLPNTAQTAACNQGIKIPNYLYTLFWDQGDWFYEVTRQTAQLQITSGQNGTKCPTSTSSARPSSTAPASPSTNPNPDNSSSPNVGAIVGGVVGGVGLLVIAALVFWFSRRRRSRGIVDLTEEREPDMTYEPYVDRPTTAQPYEPSNGAPASSATYTHPNLSSDTAPTAAYLSPQRPAKAGLIATSPPNRDEVGQSTTGPSSSGNMSDRHEDSNELTNAFGLGRSASGRLPPTYQER